MEDSRTLLCSSKFSWAPERISSKFIDNLVSRPQKVSPAVPWIKYRLYRSTTCLQVRHVVRIGCKKLQIWARDPRWRNAYTKFYENPWSIWAVGSGQTYTHTHTSSRAGACSRASTHTHRTWRSWNLSCFFPNKFTVHKKRVPCELQEELYSVFKVLLVSLLWWEIQISSYFVKFDKLSYLTQLCVRWLLNEPCEQYICWMRLTI